MYEKYLLAKINGHDWQPFWISGRLSKSTLCVTNSDPNIYCYQNIYGPENIVNVWQIKLSYSKS